jgi:hypothetical protein
VRGTLWQIRRGHLLLVHSLPPLLDLLRALHL